MQEKATDKDKIAIISILHERMISISWEKRMQRWGDAFARMSAKFFVSWSWYVVVILQNMYTI